MEIIYIFMMYNFVGKWGWKGLIISWYLLIVIIRYVSIDEWIGKYCSIGRKKYMKFLNI